MYTKRNTTCAMGILLIALITFFLPSEVQALSGPRSENQDGGSYGPPTWPYQIYPGSYPFGGATPWDYGKRHTGVDIQAAAGTPVYAVCSGKIVWWDDWPPGVSGPWVNTIWLGCGNGDYFGYVHLDDLKPHANVGDQVRIGEQIAVIGPINRSGVGTDDHLHFQKMNRDPTKINGGNLSWFFKNPTAGIDLSRSPAQRLKNAGGSESLSQQPTTQGVEYSLAGYTGEDLSNVLKTYAWPISGHDVAKTNELAQNGQIAGGWYLQGGENSLNSQFGIEEKESNVQVGSQICSAAEKLGLECENSNPKDIKIVTESSAILNYKVEGAKKATFWVEWIGNPNPSQTKTDLAGTLWVPVVPVEMDQVVFQYREGQEDPNEVPEEKAPPPQEVGVEDVILLINNIPGQEKKALVLLLAAAALVVIAALVILLASLISSGKKEVQY